MCSSAARPGAAAGARRGLALALAGMVAAGLCGPGACAGVAGSSAHRGVASARRWPAMEQQASLQRTLAATEQVLAKGDHHLLRGGAGGGVAGAADRREQANVKNGLSGMVMPVVMVLVFLFIITLMKECARMMWRRALMRTMNKLKANQEVFVLGGNEFPPGEVPMLESGRWSIKWQDGHRERYTSLTLRVDPVTGTFMGTGRDSAGECVLEGVFHLRRDRIAWTQVYSARRHQMQMEAWGFLRRDGERGPVVGRGQFQTSDAIGSRGSFVLRPVLVESIIAQIMQRINLRPPPPSDRPPVPLRALPPDCAETMDMTCAICLDENRAPTPPPAPGDEEAGQPAPESHESGAEPSGMLACGHAFHKACIEKWLREHDECPTCKQVVRVGSPAAGAAGGGAESDDEDGLTLEGLRSQMALRHARDASLFPTILQLRGAGLPMGIGRGPMVVRVTGMSQRQRGAWRERRMQRLSVGRDAALVAAGSPGPGLRQLDVGLHQLERSLVSLENEVRSMVDRMHVPYLAPLDDDEPWQHAPSQGSQGRHTAANSTLQNSRGRGAALRLEELSLQRLEELEDGMVSHDGNLFVAHDGALVGDVSHVSHLAGLAGRAHPRADLPWLEAMDDARLHPAVNSARRVFRLQGNRGHEHRGHEHVWENYQTAATENYQTAATNSAEFADGTSSASSVSRGRMPAAAGGEGEAMVGQGMSGVPSAAASSAASETSPSAHAAEGLEGDERAMRSV